MGSEKTPQNETFENVLNQQRRHWEATYSEEPYLYGESPSYAARKADSGTMHRGLLALTP